jgi:hypothetical protein
MKFVKFIAIFYFFLITSSYAVNISKKSKKCSFPTPTIDTDFNFWVIIKAFYSTASTSFVDSVSEDIKTILKIEEWTNKEKCDTLFKTEYNKNIAALMNAEIDRAEKAAVALEDKLKVGGLTSEESTQINALAAKPKEQCQKMIEIQKIKTEESNDNKLVSQKIVKQLEKEIKRGKEVTQVYLNKKVNDVFNSNAKKIIAEYAAVSCPDATKFIECLTTFKGYVSEQTLASDKTLSKLMADKPPKCKYFPATPNGEMKCEKAGILLKLRAYFGLIKVPGVLVCIGLSKLADAIGKIVDKVTETVLDKIFNILGSFVYAGVKIVYYIIKMFHQFYKLGEITSKIKATDSADKKIKDTQGKSQALGNALGYGFRIVKSVIEMVGGRKHKHRRLKLH